MRTLRDRQARDGFDVHGDHFSVRLEEGQVLRLDGDLRGVEIRSMGGRVWVTQADDAEDHIVDSEHAFLVPGIGRVVVQALEPAAVTIEERLSA